VSRSSSRTATISSEQGLAQRWYASRNLNCFHLGRRVQGRGQALHQRILLLLPAFFISYFYNGFTSTWLTTYFTVRARAFSSFFTNFAGIFSSFIIAALLDNQKIHIKTRAKIAFLSIITILVGTWIWATILQKQFYDMAEPPVFDWFKGGFGKSYALVFFWQFGGQAFQQFLYWLVGQYATDLSNLSHHTGILRGVEALGQTVAWAMQSEGGANHFVSIGINFGFTILCIFPTWIVISRLEHAHEVVVTEEDAAADAKLADGKAVDQS
jgi:hypothetical protein